MRRELSEVWSQTLQNKKGVCCFCRGKTEQNAQVDPRITQASYGKLSSQVHQSLGIAKESLETRVYYNPFDKKIDFGRKIAYLKTPTGQLA